MKWYDDVRWLMPYKHLHERTEPCAIDFHALQEVNIPNLYNGEGIVSARMFMDFANKMMISRLPVDASIGAHTHLTGNEDLRIFTVVPEQS